MGHIFLQNRIRKGKASLLQLLATRQWLAACVVAGSVLEALLYLALSRERGETFKQARMRAAIVFKGGITQRSHLRSFHLPEFAQTAHMLGLLGEKTVDAVCTVHNYRCYLHANRVYSEGKDCTEDMALFSASVVQLVERDLRTEPRPTEQYALAAA